MNDWELCLIIKSCHECEHNKQLRSSKGDAIDFEFRWDESSNKTFEIAEKRLASYVTILSDGQTNL